ncbi:helix-turn-helix domain-containing protein [Streptomyces alanosinicus]|uniref:HTH cro/C1-type domain-containing protein n=1 Tax=Streptomyces alanosinicus TaxID=68171 RepID=A0A919D7H3_9ACTN|nr:XRE family transcriptional regulator [Streptomyces alanosinicus]GHE10777.1 hypothetical protein GCM10010339_68080 [Streptomyces alanosinicus]
MPRWKDLPEELDPQIREFTSQVRRLVDRSGLSVAALADRTGYSKTSWERYLGGRLLAPKGAVVALAEVTGTNPVHLTTMWELAERAWSRAEMRHDRTMEAIRISQARAALGEFGAAEATGGPSGRPGGTGSGRTNGGPPGRTGAGRTGGGIGATTGIAGPAGVSPTIPPQPTAPDADAREGAGPAPADRDGTGTGTGTSGGNSWGLAGYQGPSPASGRPGTGARADAGGAGGVRPGTSPDGPGWTPSTPNPYDGPLPPQGAPPARRGSARRQRVIMFAAGAVGVLVVMATVYFLTDRGARHDGATGRPSPAATHASPPPGVKCTGSACDGKDAEAMGCSGDLVSTAKTATVGTTTLEVRYSKACGAAWGRITGAAAGDKVHVLAGRVQQTGETSGVGDTIAYTPMVAVKDAAQAKACATLASGRTGCTK